MLSCGSSSYGALLSAIDNPAEAALLLKQLQARYLRKILLVLEKNAERNIFFCGIREIFFFLEIFGGNEFFFLSIRRKIK